MIALLSSLYFYGEFCERVLKATDKGYANLPGCCRYREGAKCGHEKEDW